MISTNVTLVTGASSGAGREIAIHLSRSRRLLLHGRDAARLAETRDRCERPSEHILWTQDLEDTVGIAAPLAAIIETQDFGVDGFVHCAGRLAIAPLRLTEPRAAAAMMAVPSDRETGRRGGQNFATCISRETVLPKAALFLSST